MLEGQWPHYNYSGNTGLMGLNTGGLINPCKQWWCEFRIDNSLSSPVSTDNEYCAWHSFSELGQMQYK